MRHVQSRLDVFPRCERVTIRDGLRSGGVIPCIQARILAVGREQLPTYLERDGGNLRLLPGIPNSPNPGFMVRQRPIGLRLMAEWRVRVKMSGFHLPILPPLRLLADGVHMLECVQEQGLLFVP